ncbi:MAG TPA: GNAT family N-acetyltransferase [Pirellulales bacterium]|nr:GNAT family N-acetyltransferase [Pirellulales bacterium]
MLLTHTAVDPLRVEPLTSSIALADLAGPWNALAGDVTFRRWEWLEAWWRHYRRPGMDLFVLAVRDADGEWVGLAPWYIDRSIRAGRVVRFLGSGEVCSDYLSLLTAPGRGAAVARRVAHWLAEEGAGDWDLIELDGAAANDETLGSLADSLTAQGHTPHRRERPGTWRVELPGGWAAYTRRLSKSRKGGVRTLEIRYFDTGRAVRKSVESEEELPRGLAVLRDLHQRRRASLGDRGCFASPRFDGFLTEVARRFLALGELRLHWVELDGRPVAAQIDFVSGDTYYNYQSGIAPDAMADKPGWLIQMASLKDAIDEGLPAYDFLRGDEPYKASWRAERHALMELRIVGRRPAARLRHRAWLAGARVKRWLRARWAAGRRPPFVAWALARVHRGRRPPYDSSRDSKEMQTQTTVPS